MFDNGFINKLTKPLEDMTLSLSMPLPLDLIHKVYSYVLTDKFPLKSISIIKFQRDIHLVDTHVNLPNLPNLPTILNYFIYDCDS